METPPMEEGSFDEKDGRTVFIYKSVEHVYADEVSGSILITQKCIDENKLDIDAMGGRRLSEHKETYEKSIKDGYDYIIYIENLCPEDGDYNDYDDKEATLVVNGLPPNLLELDGCYIKTWCDG